jgi:hypothetical protein
MPDFDEKQDGWTSGGKYSYCAPVAVANSLWWLDSEFNPSNLVTSYGAWGDHDPQNVPYLVQNLATLMKTNFGGSFGTNTTNIGPGIQAYLAQQGVSRQFTVKTVMAPNFTYVESEVERCDDVVLVLGPWVYSPPSTWYRETYPYPAGVGHCVTVAGINSTSTTPQIGISDPYNDTAVYGLPGVVLPPTHPGPGYPSTLHNNASYVSHDIYNVILLPPGSPGQWALQNYAIPYIGIAPGIGPGLYAVVEAAVITSPLGVGGIWVPVDKLALLAPYIALASTIILAVAATAVIFKRKKK